MGDKMCICTINVFQHNHYKAIETIYDGYRAYRSAGLMSGTKAAIDEFYDLYQIEYNKMINRGFYGLEESVITLVMETKPDKFDTYYVGDYHTIFKDIPFITSDLRYFIKKIYFCNEFHLHEKGSKIIMSLITSMEKNLITTDKDTLLEFLLIAQICLFYAHTKYLNDISAIIQGIWDFIPSSHVYFEKYNGWQRNLSYSKFTMLTYSEFQQSPLYTIVSIFI
jgi:hypothetical protein